MDTNTATTPAVTAPPPTAAPVETVAPAAPAVAPSAIAAAPETPAAPAAFVAPKGFEAHGELFLSSAKGLGLEGEKAQQFAAAFAGIDAAQAQAADAALDARESAWLAEAKADPDIGGSKWDASMKDVQRALARFGGPVPKGQQMGPLAALLDRAGLGNNALILKAFAHVGRSLKDDSIAGTSRPVPVSGERMTDAQALYGAHNNTTQPAE